jgi:predicted nucleotidyltransferase
LERFASDPDIAGVFLGGSIAAGTADAYSDIDLRVVVKREKHADFVARRREIPKEWPGFLFNEWTPARSIASRISSPSARSTASI